jgi:hypothetical protein
MHIPLIPHTHPPTVPWIFYVLYLASSGDMTVVTSTYVDSEGATQEYNYREFTYTTNTKYAICDSWTSYVSQ